MIPCAILSIRIAAWNANGLCNHKLEVERFLIINIDIDTTGIKNIFYNQILLFHQGKSSGHRQSSLWQSSCWPGFINKSRLKYIEVALTQAAEVKLMCGVSDISVYAVYHLPRHAITSSMFKSIFCNLGPRFKVGGDFNAKH